MQLLTCVFSDPRARRALIYANIMILLGQLTGVNAIMYYVVLPVPATIAFSIVSFFVILDLPLLMCLRF